MPHRFRQAAFIVVALAFVSMLAPYTAVANHNTTPRVSLPGNPANSGEQGQVLRPDLRSEIDLNALPSYSITATLDLAAATLQGEQHVTFTNPSDGPLDTMVFRLLPNADTIYSGGSLTVTRVARGDAEAPWTLSADGTVLTVTMAPPLQPRESVVVGLDFAAVIPTSGGYGIFHHSARITSLAAWYPVLAPYVGGWQADPVPAVGDANHFPVAVYDVTLAAPATHTVVSTGTTLDVQQDGASKVWRLVSGPARGFAIALSDRFSLLSTEREGVKINYYALSAGAGRSPEESLQIAADAFGVYQRRFGPYPYNEFDVVETLVTVGGYEFAGMVFIEQGLRAGGSLSQLRFIVSHEVAHQWWYALVGSDPVNEPWLDESLATYSAAIYLEDVYGVGASRGLLGYYASEGGKPNGAAPGIDVSALDYADWRSYRGPVYYRGALFMDALRREIGDDAFFGMLRHYTLEHRFGIATTRDLTATAEEFAGRPLDDLYRLWFGTPDPGV